MRPLLLYSFCLSLFLPLKAEALTLPVTSRIAVIAQSTQDDSAHWVNTVANLPQCSNRLWFPYEDKEMYATALTAQANKLDVEIWYDDAAATKSFPGYGGTSSCRVVSINMKYVP